ncbi:hypothetical protein F5B22DRAFT_535666 [Xylaria bambusicola]|uniref:uncharacterized protein n=1 Tax=Xylaria bambusicola TaxID=326684 RepID=UPI0020079CBE|nr:uncharacterized protein F5B22DRAFT_535666 [Xylaria bambusicola]KAI0505155.1 hypothetical protein F5B22DRAFT_535666 [Xylaria bambusicola]
MNDDYLSYPARSNSTITSDPNSQHILVFFVPGNPGLIGYYAPFLSTLRDLLDSNASLAATTNFHIHGQNLAGFIDEDHEPFTSQRKPHNLEYQIQHILTTVTSLRTPSGPKQGQPYDHVLLVGHSVGAYIALETCHRVLRDPSLAPHTKLSSGILLFPTIEHITDSSNGWKLNMLRQTPLLGDNAYRVAQGFLRLWPYDTLHWFVSKALGFPPHAADVTTRWLKSRDGVWQALHLGMDEMRVIREDKWDNELWDIDQSSKSAIPRFYFFFGRRDHWVADHYRDAFIKKRSEQDKRTRLIVDEADLPHAFCIEHSEPVAQKVYEWILEMFGTHT